MQIPPTVPLLYTVYPEGRGDLYGPENKCIMDLLGGVMKLVLMRVILIQELGFLQELIVDNVVNGKTNGI